MRRVVVTKVTRVMTMTDHDDGGDEECDGGDDEESGDDDYYGNEDGDGEHDEDAVLTVNQFF